MLSTRSAGFVRAVALVLMGLTTTVALLAWSGPASAMIAGGVTGVLVGLIGATSSYWGQLYTPLAVIGTAALVAGLAAGVDRSR